MQSGRPTKYKPEYCEAIIEHMSEGASITSFAASIGVARETITGWVKQYPEFSLAVKRAKAKCASWWEMQGRLGATGEAKVNPTLVIFGLKNMAGEDWRERQEVDVTSKGEQVGASSDAVLAALKAKYESE